MSGVEYVIYISVTAVGLPEVVIIAGGVVVAAGGIYAAWKAGELVGRWVSERRAQAGQQADEKKVKRAAEEICGRPPTREEQELAHRQKQTGEPDRDLMQLLWDLLDAMNCEQDPHALAEWQRRYAREVGATDGVREQPFGDNR